MQEAINPQHACNLSCKQLLLLPLLPLLPLRP
jgi:hypothetical protein